jgi:hypothetical protein
METPPIMLHGSNPGVLGIVKPKIMVLPPYKTMETLSRFVAMGIMTEEERMALVKRFIAIDTAVFQVLDAKGLLN